jgi:adenylate cyclase, class 2
VAPRPRTIREIEIKLRINDLPAILGKIRGLAVRPHVRVFEQNVLYDTPESDFRRRGHVLRLRTETVAPNSSVTRYSREIRKNRSRAILTSKIPVPYMSAPRFKVKLETEVAVSNPSAWRRAVQKLGLSEGFRYEKYRTSFTLGGAHLDLDETPVGDFLEIEGRPAEIDRIAHRLGFSPRDYIRATYWDLYVAECRHAHRKPGNLLFSA